MDGIHDLGGLEGFGPVEVEPDEPVFHEDWERRTFRISAAAGSALRYSGGAFRHSIERMDPGHYLTSSYYEHWLTGISTLIVEAGLVSAEELDRRAGGRFPLSRPDRGTVPASPEPDRTDARFAVGDRVRVREWHPPVTPVRRGTCRANEGSSCGSTVRTACPTSRRTALSRARTDLFGALHGS